MKDVLQSTNGKLIYKGKRDKNYTFCYLYNIDSKRIRETLLSLEEKEFLEKVKDRNQGYENRFLYIWNPIREFVAASGEKRNIELYIKTDLYEDKNLVVVLSFHKIKDYS